MAKIVENLQTELDGQDVGTLVISWDLEYSHDLDERNPFDTSEHECREVHCINSIELQIFDGFGVDMLPTFTSNNAIYEMLKERLLQYVESKSIEDLKGEEVYNG